MRRSSLFLVIAALCTAVMVTVWACVLLFGGRPPSVPAGETREVDGVSWHLDWMRQVMADDPALASTYPSKIPGAAYVMAQFTVTSDAEFQVCGALAQGNGRTWMATNVTPVAEPSLWCQPITGGTLQLVATVPPTAVAELRGIIISFGNDGVLLLGAVENP